MNAFASRARSTVDTAFPNTKMARGGSLKRTFQKDCFNGRIRSKRCSLFLAVVATMLTQTKPAATFSPRQIPVPSQRFLGPRILSGSLVGKRLRLTAATPSSHYDDDDEREADGDNLSPWLKWMTTGGKPRESAKVKMREAVELGGIPRSDRYSSRYASFCSTIYSLEWSHSCSHGFFRCASFCTEIGSTIPCHFLFPLF